MQKSDEILEMFTRVSVDSSWAFCDKTKKDTSYATHGYHRYPAKFIPQLVSRLVKKYTSTGDLVVDPFGGCGTTIVESKILGRRAIGVDINPVAALIANAKITPILPLQLARAFTNLNARIDSYSDALVLEIAAHERIDYWFKNEEKRKLFFIKQAIIQEENPVIQNFFLCGFSNILKNCSIWLQKSNKPTRDLNKKPAEPISLFYRQIKKMMRGNAEFYAKLKENDCLEIPCKIYCTDARTIPSGDGTASLIVTSPPYVTSYEYADLHQLSALWFEYANDLNSFRKKFIGTSYHDKKELCLNSALASGIKQALLKIEKKTAQEVAMYFGEMYQVFMEMQRLLKKGGKLCVVIGNTSLKGVKILNAEVFVEQLLNLGFHISDIIKREIPSKNLPSTRNEKTGRFAKTTDANNIFVYPTEFIIVMEKP